MLRYLYLLFFLAFVPLQAAPQKYDIIIIGGGALGLSAAYYGAKTDKNILLLEQNTFFDNEGASRGPIKQFRLLFDDPVLTVFAEKSLILWKDLEKESNTKLLSFAGSLWFGDIYEKGVEGTISKALQTLDEIQFPYEILGQEEIETRFHFKNIPKNWIGLFEPTGAAINVKATLKTLYEGAKNRVDLKENSQVKNIESHNGSMVVTATTGTYICDTLILTPGPYVNDILAFFNMKMGIDIWDMTSAFFKVEDPYITYPTWINFQKPEGKYPELYYGSPEISAISGYVTVGANYPSRLLTSPANYTNAPDEKTLQEMSLWVKNHMAGIQSTPTAPFSCPCALLTDRKKEMVLGFLPSSNNTLIAVTGWAFKFTPLIGKILIDLATTGKTPYDITPFSFTPDLLVK